jgi:hypothetical protein
LKNTFLSAYYDSFQNQNNLEQMYGSDLFWWMLNILDYKLTGEHNGAAYQQANPKAKPKKMKMSESFKFLEGVAPIRWQKVFKTLKRDNIDKLAKDQPKKKFSLEILIDNHKQKKKVG